MQVYLIKYSMKLELNSSNFIFVKDLKGVGSKNVSHITPFQLTKQILRTEGVPGLFRGLTSTMMREMPGYFCFFGSYEGTREFLTK